MSEAERIFFRILEEVGKVLVIPQPKEGEEIPSGKIDNVVVDNFSNPLLLYSLRVLGGEGYDEENPEYLRQAVTLAAQVIKRLPDVAQLCPKITNRPRSFDDLTDKDFVNIVIATTTTKSLDEIFPVNAPLKTGAGSGDIEAMTRAASSASTMARLFRDVDLKVFLRQVSTTGTPPSVLNDDEFANAHGAYVFLGGIVKLAAQAVFSPERLEEMLAPYETFDDLWEELERTFEGQLEQAIKSETERLARAAEQKRAREEAEAKKQEEERRAAAETAKRKERERIATAQRELLEWHQEFQPVPLPEVITSALNQLAEATWVKAQSKGDLSRIQGVFQSIHRATLDYRGDRPDIKGDPEIKKLAGLLVSPTTMALVAKACDIDAQSQLKVTLPAKTPDVRNAKSLFELMERSPAARHVVYTLLDQSDGIIIPAVLLLPLQETITYLAQVKKSGGKGKYDAHYTLNQKVRAAIEELRVKGVVRRAFTVTEESPESAKEPESIPWLQNENSLSDFLWWSEGKSVFFALRADENFAFQLPAKKLRNKDDFSYRVSARGAELSRSA